MVDVNKTATTLYHLSFASAMLVMAWIVMDGIALVNYGKSNDESV